MKPFLESTKVMRKGSETFPVWLSFSEMAVNKYNNSLAEEIDNPYETIFIVNNGTVRVSWENYCINATAGQGVFIKKGTPVRIMLASNESASLYSLVFDEKFFISEGEMYDKYAREIINNQEVKVIHITNKNIQGETILEDTNRIIAANLTGKFGNELATKGILCHIWLFILEFTTGNAYKQTDNSLETRDYRRVKAACEFIAEGYADIITLGDIASHINLSEGECCRTFERVLNMSPIEYLMKYRIFSAVRILLKKPSSMETISELSFYNGFNSPSYFNRVFKACIHCSPTEYKKLIQTDIDKAEEIYTSIQEEITIL